MSFESIMMWKLMYFSNKQKAYILVTWTMHMHLLSRNIQYNDHKTFDSLIYVPSMNYLVKVILHRPVVLQISEKYVDVYHVKSVGQRKKIWVPNQITNILTALFC